VFETFFRFPDNFNYFIQRVSTKSGKKFISFRSRPIARFQALGEKYIFRKHDFSFCYLFKTIVSGHNKIWGAQNNFGETAPESLPGYEPVQKYFILVRSRIESEICAPWHPL